MKGKTLIALIIAVLMVASIVSAGAYASLGNILYDKMAARTNTDAQDTSNSNEGSNEQSEIQTITNTGAGQNSPGAACVSQSDCPNGNCVCRCAQRPTPTAVTTTATPAAETPASSSKTLTLKGLKIPTARAISIPGFKTSTGTLKLPSAGKALGEACSANLPCAAGLSCTNNVCARSQANAGSGSNTGTSACNACLARCTASCASSGQTPPPQTGDSSGTATLPCTSNNQCSAGVCFIARVNEGVCWSLREIGGLCDENADCRSNNCANMVTTGSARRGICALTVASGSGTLSTGIKIKLPFTARAISISGFKTPTGIITPPPAGTPVLPDNGAVCTTPSQCTSRICSLQAATATRAAQKLCSATCRTSADCERGTTCSSGICGTPDAPQLRANGIACANNAQCSSGYCNRPGKVCAESPSGQQTLLLTCEERCVETCSQECMGQGQEVSACMQECNEKQSECVSTKNECQTRCRQRDEPIEALQGCIDGCDAGFEACGEDVRQCRSACPAGREVPGTKKVGDECSSSTGCETECETGYGECGCTEAEKKQEGESCGDDEECEADLECAGGFLGFGKNCAKVEAAEEEAVEEAVVEALPLEVQAQVRAEISSLEPMLEAMEQQVVQDRLVDSRAELVAMNPGCFGEITDTDVEQNAECVGKRFKAITDLLESKNIITHDKSMELKENAGIEERIVEVSPLPIVQRSFTDRIKNIFGISGAFTKVTGKIPFFPGYDLDIDLPPDTGSADDDLSSYLFALNTQYDDLTELEDTICSKLPLTMLNRLRLPSCSMELNPDLTILTAFECGFSGAVKCVSGKCEVNKEDVCPVGEFGAAEPPTVCTTDAQCSVGETLPPATCDDPISFEIVSACRGLSGTSYGFVNFTLRNTGSIDIDEFK
ncbi:MAG: hypothetical protein KJ955_03655, partial [Nanoarchaeota archaeon]|nr:hypothetical protein [Nanoarchaeota archaeon]